MQSSTNGSFTGYFLEPHSVECSRICCSPVSLYGGVLKPIENTLLLSSLETMAILAPLFLCLNKSPVESKSSSFSTEITSYFDKFSLFISVINPPCFVLQNPSLSSEERILSSLFCEETIFFLILSHFCIYIHIYL